MRGRQRPHDGSAHFLARKCLHAFRPFSRRTLSPGGKTFRRFFFFRQSVSALLEHDKTNVLLVHDYFRGWNCKSLFLNTVHLLSTSNILPSSFPRWRFSLCDPQPVLLSQSFHSGHWSCASYSSDQYVVLPWSSIFGSLAMPAFDQFLGRTLLILFDAEQNLVFFHLHKSSRTFSIGMLLAANRARSHLVSKSWMSSSCKQFLNRSDGPCGASQAPVARKCS